MKKTFIVIFNIILFISLYLMLDFSTFVIFKKKFYNGSSKNYFYTYITNFTKSHNFLPFIHKKETDQIINAGYTTPDQEDFFKYRPIENKKQSPEKSIVVFGCSFAYGDKLKNTETFSYQLGKLTDYTVYNRSKGARSVQHMLYQLENDDFYKLIPKADYLIYIFYPAQIRRSWIQEPFLDRSVYYKRRSNDTLKLRKFSINYFKDYLLGIYSVYLYENYKMSEKEVDFYFLHLLQANRVMKEHWGNNAKFIFFLYDNHPIYYTKWLDELKKEGIIVISLEDLSDKDFCTEEYQVTKTDPHPNAKAWAEITPLLLDNLKKRGVFK